MNPEMVNEVTALAGVAGYVAGMVADQVAVRRAARQAIPLTETWDLALADDENQTAEPSRTAQAARRTGRVLFAELALVGGIAAGLNAYAWAPESTAVEQAPPTLEIVVDHSGATGLALQGDTKPVVAEVNQVVNEFSGVSNVKAEAIVASSGTQLSMKVDKVVSNQPFGNADMASATSLALSRAAETQPVSADGTLKPNAGVLIITNGNEVGKTQAVVKQATQQYGPASVKTPVFVVNVEGAKAGEQVAHDLQALATQTGAQYWSADKDNLDSVAKAVRSTIISSEVKSAGGPDKAPLKLLGGLTVLAAIGSFIRRGNKPFGRGVKGE